MNLSWIPYRWIKVSKWHFPRLLATMSCSWYPLSETKQEEDNRGTQWDQGGMGGKSMAGRQRRQRWSYPWPLVLCTEAILWELRSSLSSLMPWHPMSFLQPFCMGWAQNTLLHSIPAHEGPKRFSRLSVPGYHCVLLPGYRKMEKQK